MPNYPRKNCNAILHVESPIQWFYLLSLVNHASNLHFVWLAPLLDAMPSSLVLQLYHFLLQSPQLVEVCMLAVSSVPALHDTFDHLVLEVKSETHAHGQASILM